MTGSIVQRGDRLHTVVRPIDPATGKQKPVWKAVHKDPGMGKRAYREAAERQLRQMLAQYDRQGYVARAGRVTLGEHLEEWLRAKELEGIRPSTLANYRTLVRSRIAPAVGALVLSSVTPTDVRRYLQSKAATNRMVPARDADKKRITEPDGRTRYVLTDDPVAPRTVQLQYAILRAALQDAVDMEIIQRNPAAKVRPPRGDRQREPRRLTFQELATFLEAAERVSPRYAVLYHLAAVTGLRVGSLLALRWSDVDLGRSVIEIRKAKTQTSEQAMPIDHDAADALKCHRSRQNQERLMAGPLWKNEGWVFANEAGGAPRYRQVAVRELARIVAAAGIGQVRMHDLRHTAGSRMLEAGVDPKTVADRLGHKDMAFFLKVYAGSVETSHKRAADIMGEALAKARQKAAEHRE